MGHQNLPWEVFLAEGFSKMIPGPFLLGVSFFKKSDQDAPCFPLS